MSDLPHHRWMQIVAAVAVGAAGIGFLTGTRGAPVPQGLARAADEPMPREGLRAAPRYAALREVPKPGRTRQAEAFARMRSQHDPATSERPRDPAGWREAIEGRMARRAFEGAPPRSPHPVDGVEAAACVVCHGEGLRVFGKVAAPMPHEAYANCQQCHASERTAVPPMDLSLTVAEENGFEGLAPRLAGPRAFEGAPPQLPHPTWLRERCVSCHGTWAEGLRVSHPWRQNCLQCHAPAAEADQRPLGGVPGEARTPLEAKR